MMVNYRYDLKEIETNHEAYANEGKVAAARSVRGLVKPPERVPVTQRLLGAAEDTSKTAAAPRAGALPRQKPTSS